MITRKTVFLVLFMIFTSSQYADNLGEYYYTLSGTWRSFDSINVKTDVSIDTSWGVSYSNGFYRDFIIDLNENHQKGTYWGTTDGRWHIMAHGLHLVTKIEELAGNVFKLYLDENWIDPECDNPGLRGGGSGVVYIKLLEDDKITLRIGDESDKHFQFLSLRPEYGYEMTWIRTDGPQEEFQQEAN